MTALALSRSALALRKIQGCLTEFGLRETARRCWREIARAVRRRDTTHLDAHPVHPRLWVGAAPRSEAALAQLTAAGVRAVIDLRAERAGSDLLVRGGGLTVRWVPTYDDWRPKPAAFYAGLREAARAVWRDDPEARVLICCGAGEHRGPLGAALVLADLLHDLDEALRRIAAARPVAEFLPAYLRSLRAYWQSRRAA